MFTYDDVGTRIAYVVYPAGAPPEIPVEIWIDDRSVREVPRNVKSLKWVEKSRKLMVVLSDKNIVFEVPPIVKKGTTRP
jgi:hypothetical protein